MPLISFSRKISSLEWLAYAKENVEVAQALGLEYRRRQTCDGVRFGNRLKVPRRIQIVPKVKAQGPDWCLVAYSYSGCMRSVIIAGIVELGVALLVRCTSGQALRGIGLVPAQKPFQHIVRRGKDVPH